MRVPTLDAWNMMVQQQLSSSASLQIGYIGSHGIHNMFDSSNQANPNQQTSPASIAAAHRSAAICPSTRRRGNPTHWMSGIPITTAPHKQIWASNSAARLDGHNRCVTTPMRRPPAIRHSRYSFKSVMHKAFNFFRTTRGRMRVPMSRIISSWTPGPTMATATTIAAMHLY